jgi:hypothetical protein
MSRRSQRPKGESGPPLSPASYGAIFLLSRCAASGFWFPAFRRCRVLS